MSDTLYLSLWYPNLRLEALPEKLAAVLDTFAAHGGEQRVYSATVWPVSWSESPVFQRVYRSAGKEAERGVPARQAVAEAMELMHDDYAYEFQIGWNLWEIEAAPGLPPHEHGPVRGDPGLPPHEHGPVRGDPGLDPRWVRQPRLVRVTGYGPLFDEGAYEQDGHIKIDFGPDTPFLGEDTELDAQAAKHVEENVRQLVELAAAVEKGSGATARILWSELGESLAQRLAARLGVNN